MTNIFVGNLSYQTTQEELYAAFAQYGAVGKRVNIVTDRGTGQPRGFAFVEMTDAREVENRHPATEWRGAGTAVRSTSTKRGSV